MAISPPSDIVMDVMRAADPARVQAATRALTGGRAVAGVAAANVNAPARTADAGAFAARLASAEKAPARAAAGRTVAGVRFQNAAPLSSKGPVNLLAGLDVSPRAESTDVGAVMGRAPRTAEPFSQAQKAAPLTRDDDRKVALHKAYAGLEGLLVRQMLEGALAAGGIGGATLFGSGLAGSTWRSMMAATIADTVTAAGGLGLADQLLADPVRLKALMSGVRG